MIGYPLDILSEEVAYVAYHFHWPYDQVMGLEHNERKRWVEEIAKIKLPDLNCSNLESAKRQVEGTARSAGIIVKG